MNGLLHSLTADKEYASALTAIWNELLQETAQ